MIKILVPVDDSAGAVAAVRHAAFLFREGSVSEVVLFNVQPALEGSRASAFHSLAGLREFERRHGEAALAEACEILDDFGVRYSTQIGLGEIVSSIVGAAESLRCDGIVLGISLWSQIKACLGGGLPARLIRHTSVPVTVVKSSGSVGAGMELGQVQPRRTTYPHPQMVVYSRDGWNHPTTGPMSGC
ncbi:universal stress protein [Cupriavidus sp. UYMMa02A]|nr:universal stress protein [Cupriavidus sp. UYMMa02A]